MGREKVLPGPGTRVGPQVSPTPRGPDRGSRSSRSSIGDPFENTDGQGSNYPQLGTYGPRDPKTGEKPLTLDLIRDVPYLQSSSVFGLGLRNGVSVSRVQLQ